jgi:hypothetical protein
MTRFNVKVSKRDDGKRPEFLGCDGCVDNSVAQRPPVGPSGTGEGQSAPKRRTFSPLTDR